MSLKGILYHVASGAIVSVNEGNILQTPVATGYAMLGYEGNDVVSGEDKYIVAAQVSLRTVATFTVNTTSAAPGDTVTLSGLPANGYIYVNNDIVKVTGTTYQYSMATEGGVFFRLAGKYKSDVTFIRYSSLAAEQERLKVLIDTDAESSRSRVVTPGSGQAMTYLRKADAAFAFLANETLSDAQMLRITL
jgi:uncharacterized protein YsxB (DUF464 family)